MEKYALIRKKRDQSKAKRQDRIKRRTFPPSRFQLTPLIETTDIIEPIMEPIVEPILLAENCLMSKNQLIENEVLSPDIIIEKPDIIHPDIIAQVEEKVK